MSSHITRFPTNILGVISGALLLLSAVGVLLLSNTASGIQLQLRELKLEDARAGSTTRYMLSMQTQTLTDIGSIRVQFCSNDALVGEPCTAPLGLDVSTSNVASQSGMAGFSVHPSTTANVLILSRVPATNPLGIARYELANVINPSASGSYYARLETFASTDASGVHIDYGGLAFNIRGGLSVTTTVPPFLLFCVANTINPYSCASAQGNYVDFGELSADRTATAQTKMLVSTNAEFGYAIRAQGTTMLSGINTIDELSKPDVSRPGKSQFGLNIRANSTPNIGQDPSGPGTGVPVGVYNSPNQYAFVSGAVVATNASTEDYRLYTMSYIVNVDKKQPPGVYVTTLTYIALAAF